MHQVRPKSSIAQGLRLPPPAAHSPCLALKHPLPDKLDASGHSTKPRRRWSRFYRAAFSADMLCAAGVLAGPGGPEGGYDCSQVVPNEDSFREGQLTMFKCALQIRVEGPWLTCERRLVPHCVVSAVVVHANRNHSQPRCVLQFLPGGPIRHQRGALHKVHPIREHPRFTPCRDPPHLRPPEIHRRCWRVR